MTRSTIQIQADDRESRSPVVAALEAQPFVELQVLRLPLGDYLIDNLLLVERKTLIDLTESIIDGRLLSQAHRLAVAPVKSVLILEGTATDLAATRMRREAVQGALISLTLVFGIPLLRARDATETAQLMLFAAAQMRRQAGGALPRSGRRPRGKSRLQQQILQGLPGVGPARAKRLIEHFGSVEAVITADPRRLAEVPGIGPSVAETIQWAVKEPRPAYCG
jgi:ERCC4-type nuclease